jgi:hypothetical protein
LGLGGVKGSLLVRCHRVVNKGCRLSPSAFLLFAYIAPVVRIYRTRVLIHYMLEVDDFTSVDTTHNYTDYFIITYTS